ncbi:MAG: hypothetical protein COA45_04330 [Zetaproteobacteria bacterium]|nr:MAG: hypothetical protein COA45_04330 [Zetaproteobacteria bacterium]
MYTNSKKQNNTQKKSRKFLMSTTAFVAGMLLAPAYASAQSIPTNSWDYDVVLDGNVGKDTSVAGVTDITVTGGNGFVEGNADIYTGHTVNVTGDNSATFAYRDNRANIETTLNGNLNSNMKIVIIDKDGVFFGPDSQIDVQSIVATTGNISVDDIMDGGQLEITDVDEGGYIGVNGTITVAEAGLVAFVASHVTNNAVINATLGRVQMGAAKTVTVDLYGDGLLELTLDGQLADALLENNGDIIAEGGFVQMTALAAKGTVDNIVNNTGLISVASATQVGGKIILSGGTQGTVAVSGTLDATGTQGGEIEVRGERILATGAADIDASGTAGAGGKVTLQTDNIFFPVDSATFIKAKGVGGTVQIERLTQGRVSVGNKSGGLRVSQATIDKTETENLIIGNASASENNITEINVRSIDTTASISGSVQLNALSYIPGDKGHKNEGDVEFDEGTNRFNTLEVNAVDDVIFREDVVVETLDGNMTFNADADSDAATGDTNIVEFLGDDAELKSAGDITFSGVDYVDVYDGTSINADNGLGAVNFERSSDGVIGLGDAAGDMQLDQGELDNIVADTLNTGNPVAVDSNTTDINISNADVSHIDNVNLSALAASTVNFSGRNDFVNLNVNTSPVTGDINVLDGSVNATTSINFNSPLVNLNGDLNAPLITGNAGTVNVQSDAAQIQDGIDVAAYLDATVNVAAGTYLEDVNVYKEVTLLGANAGIEGTGLRGAESVVLPRGTGFNITADNVTLDGFKVEGGVTGVRVVGADNVSLLNTIIVGTRGNAIEAQNSKFLDIVDNAIIYAGMDGIHISGGWNTDIMGNFIDTAGDDGIDINGGRAANIFGNIVYNTGDDGVDVDGNQGAAITYNDISHTGKSRGSSDGNGIEVSNSGSSKIAHNYIFRAGDDGVDVEDSANVSIRGNIIKYSGDDGIDAENTSQIRVLNNTVDESENDGIYVSGAELFPDLRLPLQDTLDFARLVSEPAPSSAVISGNTVSNSGDDGIQSVNIDDLTFTENDISDSYGNGAYISGARNGDVLFQGNTLTDNGHLSGSAGARFESGDIDVSDVDNLNTFVNTTGLPAVAMQFDDVSYNPFPVAARIDTDISGGTGLRIVGETLGSTVFEGYTPNDSFYVRFEDGAILDDITSDPIVIDGTNASFDGLVPAAFGNVLSATNLNFIEERLYDADDVTVNGRGQIFAGAVPDVAALTVTNFEDFFFNPLAGDRAETRTRLDITGLPSVGDFGDLNDIAPAAGTDGGEAQDLANINPEAGGDDEGTSSKDVTCLGDVVGSLSGGAVTYSFGGTLEDSIAGASACETSTGG